MMQRPSSGSAKRHHREVRHARGDHTDAREGTKAQRASVDAPGTGAEVDTQALLALPASLPPTVLGAAALVRVDAGRVIIEAQATDTGLFGVIAGSVAVRRHAYDGSTRLLDIGNGGFWCGRTRSIALTPSAWSVSAREATAILHLRGDQVRRAWLADPAVSTMLSDLAHAQMRRLEASLEVAHASSPRRKVALELLAAAGGNGEALRLTQAELGVMTRLCRNSVNSALAEPPGRGAIVVGYRHVTVADHEALAAAAWHG